MRWRIASLYGRPLQARCRYGPFPRTTSPMVSPDSQRDRAWSAYRRISEEGHDHASVSRTFPRSERQRHRCGAVRGGSRRGCRRACSSHKRAQHRWRVRGLAGRSARSQTPELTFLVTYLLNSRHQCHAVLPPALWRTGFLMRRASYLRSASATPLPFPRTPWQVATTSRKSDHLLWRLQGVGTALLYRSGL